MDTVVIVLLVLGVIAIILAAKGKPLWNNWAKPLWNRCRALGMDGIYALVALGMDGIYALVAVLFMWGLIYLYGLSMNLLIGIMIFAIMLSVLIADNRSH